MDEENGKRYVSLGMFAAYSDMAEKLANKIAMFEKAKLTFPKHADYYDSLIELYDDEYQYAKMMAQTGREMNGTTLQ